MERTLTGHTDAVTPDGRRAASCSSDGTLKVWDLALGTLIASFSGDYGSILTCGVADGTGKVVAGDASGLVAHPRAKGTIFIR